MKKIYEKGMKKSKGKKICNITSSFCLMVCYHVNETLPIINYGDRRIGKEMKQKFIPKCQKNNPKEATSRIFISLASKIKCKYPHQGL